MGDVRRVWLPATIRDARYGPLAPSCLDFDRHLFDDFWVVSIALLSGSRLGARLDLMSWIRNMR